MTNPLRDTAGQCHKYGCNCAEAMLHAFRDELPFELSDETMKIATAFGGGGIGEFGFCGALTGSAMVLSLLCGRSDPQGSREPAYTYARELNERFVARFGANSCKVLQIHVYGTPEQKEHCGGIIAEADKLLTAFLEEKKLLPVEPAK